MLSIILISFRAWSSWRLPCREKHLAVLARRGSPRSLSRRATATAATEPRGVVMMAVDRVGAFFGSGFGDVDRGRVRDAGIASRVACGGSCGMENGDTVRDDAALRRRQEGQHQQHLRQGPQRDGERCTKTRLDFAPSKVFDTVSLRCECYRLRQIRFRWTWHAAQKLEAHANNSLERSSLHNAR